MSAHPRTSPSHQSSIALVLAFRARLQQFAEVGSYPITRPESDGPHHRPRSGRSKPSRCSHHRVQYSTMLAAPTNQPSHHRLHQVLGLYEEQDPKRDPSTQSTRAPNQIPQDSSARTPGDRLTNCS